MKNIKKFWFLWLAAIIAIVALIVPIVVITTEGNSKSEVKSSKAEKHSIMDTDRKFWKLSNSYSYAPVLTTKSVTDSIREYLELDNTYSVQIYNYGSGVNEKNWAVLDQIKTDIYHPYLLYTFDYSVSAKNKFVCAGSVNNSWMLQKLINGIKIDYDTIFEFASLTTNDSAIKQVENNLDNFVSNNMNTFKKNINDYNLGIASDIPFVFSGLDYRSLEFNTNNKTWKTNSSSTANLLNEFVKIPSNFDFKEISENKDLPFFVDINLPEKDYVHNILNVPPLSAKPTPRFNFNAKKYGITEDTTVRDIKEDIGKFISSVLLEDTGLGKATNFENVNFFDEIHMYKSGSGSLEWTNELKLSSVWKLKDGDVDAGKHYAWVNVKTIDNKYYALNKMFNFPKNCNERVWFNFIMDGGQN